MPTPHDSESAPQRKGLAKPAMGIALVALAIGAVAIGVAREGSESSAGQIAAEPVEQPRAVTVYYFHSDTRCRTCLAIESKTERIVRERFANELAAGTLRYEAVNYDAPDDRHFRDDYDLSFGTVVVQGIGGNRPWENLSDVWSLVHEDSEEFEAYLAEHITPMLEGNNG